MSQTAEQNQQLFSKFELLENVLLINNARLEFIYFVLSRIPTKILEKHKQITYCTKKIAIIITSICDIISAGLEISIKNNIRREK